MMNIIIFVSGGMVKSPFLFLSQNPSYYAHQLAQELGIETEVSSDQILEALQTKCFDEIADRNSLFETYLFTGNPWIPIKDDFAKNPFIPGDFNTLFKEGKYNKVWIELKVEANWILTGSTKSFLNGPITASFCLISSFSHYNFNNTNRKKL